MTASVSPTSRREKVLANIGSSMVAQAWTAVLGLAVLPTLIRHLGTGAYGVLGLCAVITGVGSLMDLGVGRALGKFVAEEQESRHAAVVQKYLQVGLTTGLVMGITTAILVSAMVPALVSRFMDVPPALEQPAKLSFWLTAIAFPAVLLRMTLEGLLVGFQRIAFLNLVTMLGNTAKAGLAVAAVLAGYSIAVVTGAYTLVLYVQVLILAFYCRRRMPLPVDLRLGWDSAMGNRLLRLGGLSSVCLLAGYSFLYLDRFVVGAFLPVLWVGYYTGAFEITSKQWYIGNSVCQAFLPVFSLEATARKVDLSRSYVAATRAVATGTAGLTALLAVFSHEILAYWIDPQFAAQAAPLMAVLSLGILMSCHASVPYTLIFAGAGKPEIFALFYLVGAVLHLAASVVLVRSVGALGVALAFVAAYILILAWSLRWIQRNLVSVPVSQIVRRCFLPAWIPAALVAVLWWALVKPWVTSLLLLVPALAAGYAVYLFCVAFAGYTSQERTAWWQLSRKMLGLPVSQAPLPDRTS